MNNKNGLVSSIYLTKTYHGLKIYEQVIARWVSHVVSPHIMAILFTVYMTMAYSPTPWQALWWLILTVPFITVPPTGYVLWLVHTGHLEDFYMPQRAQRLRPLIVMMVWFVICLKLLQYWQAPAIVGAIVSIGTVLVGILSIVTLFWKVSFHGATISAVVMTLILVVGLAAWPTLFLIPLVGWSRIRLKRHTPYQVVIGCFLGAFIALVLVKYGTLSEVLQGKD